MIRKARTFRLAIAAATTAALLIVPVAMAGDPGPDAFERAVNAHLSTQMPDAVDRAVNARIASSVKVSELALSARMAGPNLSHATNGSGPDAFERAVNAHNASLATVSSPGRAVPDVVESIGSGSVSAASNGFDWSSAAIGGTAMLALVLLVSGGAIFTRHSRGRVALR